MKNDGVVVTGFDGATPLGFLAALGLLRVLNDSCMGKDAIPRLAWHMEDRWRPVLYGAAQLGEIAQVVANDAVRWADSPVLHFRYPKLEKKGTKLVGKLNPPVPILRRWLEKHVEARDTEVLEYSAALFAEGAYAPADAKKALTHDLAARMGIDATRDADMSKVAGGTAFDFTSRNANFLEQVEQLRRAVHPDSTLAALRDGSPDPEFDRTLDWDPAADAPGAIFDLRTAFHPTAEWLAFRGLAFFPVVGRPGGIVHTTACRGRRKDGMFVWAVWDRPANLNTVASLVRYPDLDKISSADRRQLGLVQVFRSALRKKADGYTGMFAPSEPV